MVRNDFVSNSSSSSFIVSLTDREVNRFQTKPKTVLDFILKSKHFDFSVLDKPLDKRNDECRLYDWNGNRRKFDKTKYEHYICPWTYNQQTDFKIELDTIKEYCKCCEKCIDNKDCYEYPKIRKCLEELNKGKNVYCFQLRSTDPIYIEDTDFSCIGDKHVIDTENYH